MMSSLNNNRERNMFTLVVLLSLSLSVTATNITIEGSLSKSTYTRCANGLERITQVTLICSSSREIFHIASLQLQKLSSCAAENYDCVYDANYKFPAIYQCEGRPSPCNFDIKSADTNCSSITKINVTFQCVSPSNVYDMCPISEVKAITSNPVYFKSPNFTQPQGRYSPHLDCRCQIQPTRNYAMTVEILYVQMHPSVYCEDEERLNFFDRHKYCGNFSQQYSLRSFSFNRVWPMTFSFVSRSASLGYRGVWFRIYANNSISMLNMSCIGSYSNDDGYLIESSILPSLPPVSLPFTFGETTTSRVHLVSVYGGRNVHNNTECSGSTNITRVRLVCPNVGETISMSLYKLQYNRQCTDPADLTVRQSCRYRADDSSHVGIGRCNGAQSPCEFEVNPNLPVTSGDGEYCHGFNLIVAYFYCSPEIVTTAAPGLGETVTVRGGRFAHNTECSGSTNITQVRLVCPNEGETIHLASLQLHYNRYCIDPSDSSGSLTCVYRADYSNHIGIYWCDGETSPCEFEVGRQLSVISGDGHYCNGFNMVTANFSCTPYSFTPGPGSAESVTFTSYRYNQFLTLFTEARSCHQSSAINMNLKCEQPTDFIHIASMSLERIDSCQRRVVSCSDKLSSWSEPITNCEGATGSCSALLLGANSHCVNANAIYINFTCISAESIEPMCPNSPRTIYNLRKPMFITSPNFLRGGAYIPHQYCACIAKPEGYSRIRIKLMYAQLNSRGDCQEEGLVFHANRTYSFCSPVDVLSMSQPTDFSPGNGNAPVSMVFNGNSSEPHRGFWFNVTTDPPSAYNLHCERLSEVGVPSFPKRSTRISLQSTTSSSSLLSTLSNKSRKTIAKQTTSHTVTTSTPPVENPADEIVTFNGFTEMKQFSRCTNAADITLVLSCRRTDAIHAESLIASRKLTCASSSASVCQVEARSWSEEFKHCEGMKGRCELRLNWLAESCQNINNIQVSFQCISGSEIHEMCPDVMLRAPALERPAYLISPNFSQPNGRYQPFTSCRCVARPNPASRMFVQMFYSELDFQPNCAKDWLQFNNLSDRNCYLRDYLHGEYPLLDFRIGEDVNINFKSGYSNSVHRGFWFKIFTAPGMTYDLYCQKRYNGGFYLDQSTASFWSTFSPTTVPQTDSHETSKESSRGLSVGETIGVGVGVVVVVLIIVSSVTAYCLVRRNTPPPSRQTPYEMRTSMNSSAYAIPSTPPVASSRNGEHMYTQPTHNPGQDYAVFSEGDLGTPTANPSYDSYRVTTKSTTTLWEDAEPREGGITNDAYMF